MDEEGKPLMIECGFCLRKNLDIREPRLMPCSHVHCFMCLKLFFGDNHQVVCPLEYCQKVCGTAIADLPVYEITEDTSRCCDVCLNKHKKTVDALIYCLDCSRKFCASHLELHDELHSDHSHITVKEYLEQAIKLETRMCKQHKAYPYILGCKNCYSVACIKCMADPSPCSKGEKGSHHELIELNKLVKILVDKDMNTKITDREEELQNIFKEGSKAQAYFDRKTAELIELLRKRRDEQVKVITEEYAQLEVDLLKHRQEDKVQLTEFIDEKVLGTWSKLRNYRLKIESQAAHVHQADIIQGYQQIFDAMEKLLKEKLPKIELPEVMELSILGEKRETELRLISSGQVIVNIEDGACIKPTIAAPISVTAISGPSCQEVNIMFTFLKDLYSLSTSSSMSHLTKYTVNGPSTQFSLHVHSITDIATNDDTVFILSYSSTHVYNSRFGYVTTWDCGFEQKVQQISCMHGQMETSNETRQIAPSSLAAVDDQVVFSFPEVTKMAIYTLTGECLKFVCLSGKVPLCTTPPVLVPGGNTSVLSLSPSHPSADQQKGLLTKVDINTGLSVWSSEKQGVTTIASYKNKFIFLASPNIITILDIQTGKEIHSFAIQPTSGTSIRGLEVFGDTLAMLTDNGLSFYKMNFELITITG